MPRDKHCHDERFARAGCHLEGHTVQEWVGILVGLPQSILNPGVAVLAGHLGEVDGRFQRFNLAEEQPALTLRVLPVFQQPGGGAGDAYVAALPPQRDALRAPG